jgi:putative heme iron utilization protein
MRKENAMQSAGFVPESERSMMDHMNADHADSNLMYVKVYGSLWRATAARMIALDKVGMDFEVTLPEGIHRLRLPFDHRLQDEADAQRTLVAMSRHAQTVLTRLAGSEGAGHKYPAGSSE